MPSRTISFRLPLDGWPRAVFETDYGLRGGRLRYDDAPVRCQVYLPADLALLALPSAPCSLPASSSCALHQRSTAAS